MIAAGLTGGIASGKSTVAAMFEAAGATIVDADVIAHRVVCKDQPAWHGIVQYFGRRILQPDGRIDRAALAALVFADAGERAALNAIVHPHVKAHIARRLSRLAATTPDAVVMVDVPLLFEVDMAQSMDTVIVVHVPEELQVARLMIRDALDRSQALVRVRAQMPIDEKRRRADIVIDNSGSLATTRAQVKKVYADLAARARL